MSDTGRPSEFEQALVRAGDALAEVLIEAGVPDESAVQLTILLPCGATATVQVVGAGHLTTSPDQVH